MSWLPNLLTILRIAATPAIVYAIMARRCDVALPLSMFAGLTDAADGYVARLLQASSRTGAYLDPIADKILLTSLYVSFGIADLVPDWLVWLIVGRDALILTMVLAGMILTSIRDFPPSIWGKISTVFQIIGALIYLASCAGVQTASRMEPAALAVVTAATLWSGAHYLWRGCMLASMTRHRA